MLIDIITLDQNQNVCLCIDGKFTQKKEYRSTRQFMESLCLQNGTTLEGCYEASRILLNHAYKRPIYIGGSCNQIFIPTSSIKNKQCSWVSLNFLLNDTRHVYNSYGYETISEKSWQKHLTDGIALKYAIFGKETF